MNIKKSTVTVKFPKIKLLNCRLLNTLFKIKAVDNPTALTFILDSNYNINARRKGSDTFGECSPCDDL